MHAAPAESADPGAEAGGPKADRAAWEALLTSALLGVDRSPPPAPRPLGTGGGQEERAFALLDAAAALTVRRRAGLRPAPGRPPAAPAPAPPDGRPLPPPAACRRLAGLLRPGADAAGRAGPAAPSEQSRPELLAHWLSEARARGFRVPAALLPELLGAARARSELRADTVALAGPRGLRLAEANPEWRYALRFGPARAEPGPPHRIWEEGLFSERVTYLTALRRADPAAARELLASTWPTERAEDRLLFLDVFQERLGAADEPFLESVLDDRSRNVRQTAAELLSALPGSALGARMAERARAAVRLRRGRIAVEPPAVCDAAMRRDGIPERSPTGRAERAFWLGEIVAATPTAVWPALLGAPGPDEVLRLPVAGGHADELRTAWARAAVRQGDAAWARALLGRLPAEEAPPPGLLGVLPREERGAWTAAFIDRNGLADAFQALVACPPPWPERLGEAVLAALARTADHGGYPWSHSGAIGAAERSMAPEAAPAVQAVAESFGPDSAWAEVLGRVAGTLRARAAIRAELAPTPDAPDTPATGTAAGTPGARSG